MTVPGKAVLLAIVLAVASLAGLSLVMLRRITADRFAVSVTTIPASGRKLMHQHPLSVRIEKSRAGRSPLQARAWVISGDGRILYPSQPLHLTADAAGKPIEEARFPPLPMTPPVGLVLALVVRLPDPSPAVLARIDQAIAAGAPEQSQLHDRVRSVARGLGGQAEMALAEVR